jgi:uncharacterized membrane protein
MDTLLIFCVIVVLVVRWFWLRDRLREMDERWSKLHERVWEFGLRLERLEREQRSQSPEPAPAAAEPRVEEKVKPVAQPAPPVVPTTPTPVPVAAPPVPKPAPVPVAARPAPMPVRAPLVPFMPPPAGPPREPAPARPRDWEAILGGNLLNKAGVLLLVIGIALALGYSFTQIGPAGRVAVSLVASFAILAAGAWFEPRERYRVFARGLLGGGWAGVYTTVYAMHAIQEARVIDNPVLGTALLIAVAAGMIVHSLRYRSETVTGLAYFIAFVTLAITQVNSMAVGAMIPLAASLLYLAHRFRWRRMALFGLIATYATCVLRGDTGAPLWQAQTVFAIFGLLFEIFDILHPESWLLPLNAVGFLGLSLLKWNSAAPHDVWMLLSGAAAAYLASAILRARSGRWHAAATLSAALAAAAIFQKFDHQWVASALAVEAELVYLCGLRLRKPYLRWLGAALFTVELGRLLLLDINAIPASAWVPVASVDVVLFYANRALCATDVWFGYAAAFVGAVIIGKQADERDRGLVWMLAGAAAFLLGWWRRLLDFRIQGYALAILGAIGIAIVAPQPVLPLGVAAVLSYAAIFAVPRLPEDEGQLLHVTAASAAVVAVGTLLWRVVPGDYLGVTWMAAALVLMELRLPQAQALAAAGAARVFYFNAVAARNYGPWIPRAIPAAAAALSYAFGWRTRRTFHVASYAGSAFLAIALWTLLPAVLVGPAWAVLAIVLMEFDHPALAIQAHLLAAAAFGRMFYTNLNELYRLPSVAGVTAALYYLWRRSGWRMYSYAASVLAVMLLYNEIGWHATAIGWAPFAIALLYAGRLWNLQDLRFQGYALAAYSALYCLGMNIMTGDQRIPAAIVVIACLFAGQLLSDRGDPARMMFALFGTILTTILLFYESSGSMLTVAWGIEGVAALSAGFALRDRLLRMPGLALLLGCILKLFLWDLRHLETVARIFSFIVLGLILVGVSWIYSRFREQVARLL